VSACRDGHFLLANDFDLMYWKAIVFRKAISARCGESLLPQEVRRLPEELARVDALLNGPTPEVRENLANSWLHVPSHGEQNRY
jgi:hypothetical protein